jgi:hypothetical protein
MYFERIESTKRSPLLEGGGKPRVFDKVIAKLSKDKSFHHGLMVPFWPNDQRTG